MIAYLSLGTNLGDRENNLSQALTSLKNGNLELCAVSSIYETEPVDYIDQPNFLNIVVGVVTKNSDPFSLLRFCLDVENRLGRQRAIPQGPRIIDIDLLLFDDLIINDEVNGTQLTLPHPRLHQRKFVLIPLVEIAADVVHPVLRYTMRELLNAVDDNSAVRVYSNRNLEYNSQKLSVTEKGSRNDN